MTHDKATPDGQRFKVPDILRTPRTIALAALAVTVPVATIVMFALSYRGLVDYGLSVGVPPWLAWAYALGFDLPIIAGEAVLFVAAMDRKGSDPRVTGWAWCVTIGFAALSAAANAGLLPIVAGRALPPVVLAIVLGFGLGEVKRHSRPQPASARREPTAKPKAAAPSTAKSTAGGRTGNGHLDEVAERRAADAYAALMRDGKQISERDFATDHCGGNRHRARRAIAAYHTDAGVVSQ